MIIICMLTKFKEDDPNPTLKDLLTLIRLVLYIIDHLQNNNRLVVDLNPFKSHDLHVFHLSMQCKAKMLIENRG